MAFEYEKQRQKKAYEKVKTKILEQIENGKACWTKPYKNAYSYNFCTSSNKFYSYFNQMLLDEGGVYATFKQILDLNNQIDKFCHKAPIHVRKGEKAQTVIFFKTLYFNNCEKDSKEYKEIEKELKNKPLDLKRINLLIKEDKIKQIQFLDCFDVFNIKQIENLPKNFVDDAISEYQIRNRMNEIKRDLNLSQEQKGDLLIKAFKDSNPTIKFKDLGIGAPKYTHGENRLTKETVYESITLPLKEQSSSLANYFSTAFHEITHATKNIIDRNDKSKSHQYAKEELVAEMGSCMVMTYLGIDTSETDMNSLAYCQSWGQRLTELSPQEIVWSFKEAIRSTEYLTDIYEKAVQKNMETQFQAELQYQMPHGSL